MHTFRFAPWWWVVVVAVALQVTVSAPASGQTTVLVIVPGYSDPWLAGMPDGTTASCWPPEGCDIAPEQSPQLAVGLCLNAGESLVFEVTGSVLNYPGTPYDPPDGGSVTNHNWDDDFGENGISDIIAPYTSCIGVFLDDAQPDRSPDPPNLDFSSAASRDYLTLAPMLKQVFFIGDGRTSAGVVQQVLIPTGATRLFLGTMDSTTWLNNVGQFEVLVTEPCDPVATNSSTWGAVKALFQ